MTQADGLYNSFAPLGNVVAMVELVMRLQNRTPGLPGMATYYGKSGLGKTTAAIWAGHKFKAHHVELRSRWTPKHFCEKVMEELGLDIGKRMTVSKMIDAIAEQLGRTQRPLLIDEADYLLRHDMVEIARDFYEGSGAPVILIGEEHLPKNWKLMSASMAGCWIGSGRSPQRSTMSIASPASMHPASVLRQTFRRRSCRHPAIRSAGSAATFRSFRNSRPPMDCRASV